MMKKEYDFSKGERGKFYNKNVNFNIPIYLEPEIENFVLKIAKKQKETINQIVNKLLFKDKEIMVLAGTSI